MRNVVDDPGGTIALTWTTPTFRHEVSVGAEQATAIRAVGFATFFEKLVCHWLIDQLPSRAHAELLRTLLDMREFYALPEHIEPPKLTRGAPLKKLSRVTRPEIEVFED